MNSHVDYVSDSFVNQERGIMKYNYVINSSPTSRITDFHVDSVSHSFVLFSHWLLINFTVSIEWMWLQPIFFIEKFIKLKKLEAKILHIRWHFTSHILKKIIKNLSCCCRDKSELSNPFLAQKPYANKSNSTPVLLCWYATNVLWRNNFTLQSLINVVCYLLSYFV